MTAFVDGVWHMRSHPILIGLSILALILCAFRVAPLWHYQQDLDPTPETKSAFLTHYTPIPVLDQFRDPDQSLARGEGEGASQGSQFVTHTKEFQYHFAMQSKKQSPLMTALRDDVSAQLVAYGAEILSQKGGLHDGFHFEYRLGKSIGTLTISPLQPDPDMHRVTPLCKGLVDLTGSIEQTEKWFPNEPAAITASVNANPR